MLAANRVFDALDPGLVRRRPVALGERFELVPGLTAELFAVPGKVPLYLEAETVVTDLEGEQTVGVALESRAGRAFYVPGCAAVTPALGRTARRGAARLLRRDALARRRDDPGRASEPRPGGGWDTSR